MNARLERLSDGPDRHVAGVFCPKGRMCGLLADMDATLSHLTELTLLGSVLSWRWCRSVFHKCVHTHTHTHLQFLLLLGPRLTLSIISVFFFTKDILNWSKVLQKIMLCYKRFLFQINAELLNFLFIKESWKIKSSMVSTKTWSSRTVFNIDNNQKCFLSSKSAY